MYENTSMTPADMAAVMGNRGGFGNGMFGDGAWWIIILFLFAMNGGWGNGFGGNGAMPWMFGQMNSNNDVQRGFDQSAVINGINGINTSLCNGFAGVNAGISNGFAQAEIAANSRQMADMNQNFAVQSALQNCCCENRAATADLKYTVATEACADRAAVGDALQAVITNMNAGIQSIKDQMCNDKIDAKNQQIADLQRQLTMANLAASQGAQTAAILANNEAQTAALEQYLAPVPRPAYIVQNPNGCGNTWNGCGCGA